MGYGVVLAVVVGWMWLRHASRARNRKGRPHVISFQRLNPWRSSALDRLGTGHFCNGPKLPMVGDTSELEQRLAQQRADQIIRHHMAAKRGLGLRK